VAGVVRRLFTLRIAARLFLIAARNAEELFGIVVGVKKMKCDCHICNNFSWEVETFLLKDEQDYESTVKRQDKVKMADKGFDFRNQKLTFWGSPDFVFKCKCGAVKVERGDD
jgi:hypothetical protein